MEEEYYQPTPIPNYNNQASSNREVPVGVKIISVLYYINFALCVIAGILEIISGIAAVLGKSSILGAWITASFVILILFLILIVAFCIWMFSIAKGLWRGHNWARITAIVFAILGILIYIFPMIMAVSIPNIIIPLIIGMVINVFIAGYLLFNRKVKEAFIL